MVDLRLSAGVTPARATDDDKKLLVPGLRDGALITADWTLARALEGKVYTVQIGSATTPVAGDVYDADQPFLALDVSTGYAAVLLSIQVYIEAASAALNEMFAETSDVKVGAGSSTAITPVNHKTDGAAAAGTTAYGAYTGNGTAAANGIEFWRDGDPDIQAAGSNVKFSWSWREMGPIVLVNTSAMLLHFGSGGADPTGFAKVTYAELVSTDVS